MDKGEKSIQNPSSNDQPSSPFGRYAPIPQGIEVLVKKAGVDADFKALLLTKRSGAAGEIGLALTTAEIALLDGAPEAHLRQIIAGTKVKPEHRAVFLGKVAALMLAAVAVQTMTEGCDPVSRGNRSDRVTPKPPVTAPAPSDASDQRRLADAFNHSEEANP